MHAAATDSLVGRSLEGRYRILERIARGGMSTVYAAVDERLDRLVAVKVMSAALSADPAFNDRFAREARAAARLTHLNTVSVYDQGHDLEQDGHHVFLVMELVEGRTLRELLRERGRLSVPEAVSIMEPVLNALAAAHRAGLVHRDVKPENILISDDGVVKVADFGLARAIESDAASTRTGLMMGTVAYCAPEQISRGVADPRSDVYAAGVVLFELLTGEPPYRGENAMNVAYQHVHSRVPAPSSRARGAAIPSEVDELVVAATDSDPAGRPSDGGAFLAEIADLRAALALPVTPVPPRARAPRPDAGRGGAPNDRSMSTTAAIRQGSGRHDTTLDPRYAQRAPQPGASTPPPPVVIPPGRVRRRRRRRTLIAVLLVLLIGAAAGVAGWWFAAGRYSRVPDVRNDTPAAAQAELRHAHYDAIIVQPGPVFDESVPAGRVVKTLPGADSRALRSARITIVVSKGPHYYPVKDVRNDTIDQARAALSSVGPVNVATNVQGENSNTIAINRVTRTDPKAGSQVTARQVITIYVSTGPPIISIPDIQQGTDAGQAESTLHKAKFKTSTSRQYSDTVPAGQVISISPTGKAAENSTIAIVVSKGPQMVYVPNLPDGTSDAQISATMQAAGLVADIQHRATLFVPPGTIVESPGAGQSVKSGSTVTVYVAD